MAKLRRITNKIFGNSATAIGEDPQIGQFGSALAGTYVGTTDVETIQELPAWEQGWIGAVTPTDQFPALPEMTAVHKVLSYQTGYLMQEGLAEYDENTIYYKGSIVKEYTVDNGFKLYYSIIDNNQGNPLTDSTSWQELPLGGGSGGLEIGDIGTSLFVDESKGKRRKLNGSIIAINANTQPFVNYLKNLQNTNPEFFTTEENWQTESALNVDGCVYKYVLDEENGKVRLPKYPEYIEINSTIAPVVGNGIALGLTDGTLEYGACEPYNSTNGSIGGYTGVFGQQLGNTYSGTVIANNNQAIGVTTDPVNSGIEANLKQTKLKLYYFVQVANDQETRIEILNDIELNNPYTLFEAKYTYHLLYNTSWLRSNSQFNPKSIYVKAYEVLQVEINEEIEEGETVELPSGTSYTKQGLSVKLSTETFTDYDFVLNTSDETFRLPIKSANLNNTRYLIETGKENGIEYRVYSDGYCEQWGKSQDFPQAATTSQTITLVKRYKDTNYLLLQGRNSDNTASSYNGSSYPLTTDSFKINNNGAIAGYYAWKTEGYLASSEIETESYLYFYIGEITQNANLIDAGRIEEQLIDKLSRNDKEEIMGWSLPDYGAGINVTLPTSVGTAYTAISDGIYVCNFVQNPANAWGQLYINGEASAYYYRNSSAYVDNRGSYTIPLSKGDVIYWSLYSTAITNTSKFYPLKGAN